MSLSKRQELFVLEYGIDHNGAAAAKRAGYSPKRTKQQAWRLLQMPTVTQAIAKIDQERRARLGIDRDWVIAEMVDTYEKSKRGAPRTWQGEPIMIMVEGREVPLMDWSPSGAVGSLALIAKQLGMVVDRHEVEVTGDVIYTLTLDRDLEQDDDE